MKRKDGSRTFGSEGFGVFVYFGTFYFWGKVVSSACHSYIFMFPSLRASLKKARRNIQTQKRSESKSNNMGCASTKPSTAVSFDDVKLVTGTPIEGAERDRARDLVLASGGVESTIAEAERFVVEAKASLDGLGPSTGATALADGADHLLTMVTAAAG